MSIFKPEDFGTTAKEHSPMITYEYAALLANAKLAKLIEAAPVVYAEQTKGTWTTFKIDSDKFSGRVMFITELPKKECEHEPNLINQKLGGWYCKHCNIKLKATWSPV